MIIIWGKNSYYLMSAGETQLDGYGCKSQVPQPDFRGQGGCPAGRVQSGWSRTCRLEGHCLMLFWRNTRERNPRENHLFSFCEPQDPWRRWQEEEEEGREILSVSFVSQSDEWHQNVALAHGNSGFPSTVVLRGGLGDSTGSCCLQQDQTAFPDAK